MSRKDIMVPIIIVSLLAGVVGYVLLRGETTRVAWGGSPSGPWRRGWRTTG